MCVYIKYAIKGWQLIAFVQMGTSDQKGWKTFTLEYKYTPCDCIWKLKDASCMVMFKSGKMPLCVYWNFGFLFSV